MVGLRRWLSFSGLVLAGVILDAWFTLEIIPHDIVPSGVVFDDGMFFDGPPFRFESSSSDSI